ncbi:MAG TPA: flagellar basal body rod protein FlgB [Bacteroidales bacterium]|nr:flagellar basal body rod protein FlgB [Bacteroidales bacterium]
MKLIDNNYSQLLAKAMDVYSLRQRVTASNIANIDTPGYKKYEVKFEDQLRKAQRNQTNMIDVNPSIVETDKNVVLENELLKMADTQMRARLVVQSLRQHFNLLQTGITGINQ